MKNKRPTFEKGEEVYFTSHTFERKKNIKIGDIVIPRIGKGTVDYWYGQMILLKSDISNIKDLGVTYQRHTTYKRYCFLTFKEAKKHAEKMVVNAIEKYVNWSSEILANFNEQSNILKLVKTLDLKDVNK